MAVAEKVCDMCNLLPQQLQRRHFVISDENPWAGSGAFRRGLAASADLCAACLETSNVLARTLSDAWMGRLSLEAIRRLELVALELRPVEDGDDDE